MSATDTVTGAAGGDPIVVTSTYSEESIPGAGGGVLGPSVVAVSGIDTVAGVGIDTVSGGLGSTVVTISGIGTVSGVTTTTTLGTATSSNQTWEQKGEAIVNRAAHYVLALWTKAGNFGRTMEQDDPIVADGLRLIEAEAVERGIPVATITADADSLFAQVQAVALQTDPPPGAPAATLAGGASSDTLAGGAAIPVDPRVRTASGLVSPAIPAASVTGSGSGV